MTKHKVTFKPTGVELEVDENTDLLTACREAGIYVKSSCGGHASCSDCLVKVLQGSDNLNPPSFEETQLIGNVFHITKERLSCQTKVTGEVTVDLSQHNQETDAEKLKNKSKSFLKGNVRKRSKAEVDEIKRERHEQFQNKKEKQDNWQKHWEKDKDATHIPRKGGGRRPKPFRTDHLDEDEDSEKKES